MEYDEAKDELLKLMPGDPKDMITAENKKIKKEFIKWEIFKLKGQMMKLQSRINQLEKER